MKGQASIEYLLVVAGALAILVPFALVFLSQSRESKVETTKAQLEFIGNDIITQTEYLYNTGGFSKRTLQHLLPNNVVSVNVTPQTRELAFYVYGMRGVEVVTFYSKVPIKGRFPTVQNFGNFVLINNESYVLICTTTKC